MRRIITRKLPSITRPDATKQRRTIAHIAMGHLIHARGHAEEAVKAHVDEHGRPSAEQRRASA
jgi:hypothetical protein